MRPIWTRPPADVSDDEYNEFYKHIAHAWNEPADRLLVRAEGRIEYTSLLYLPSKAQFDLFFRDQEVGPELRLSPAHLWVGGDLQPIRSRHFAVESNGASDGAGCARLAGRVELEGMGRRWQAYEAGQTGCRDPSAYRHGLSLIETRTGPSCPGVVSDPIGNAILGRKPMSQ